MAQQPKPPGQTRRRNLDKPGWTKLGAADVAADAPKFPGRKPPAAALRYWEAIWRSPVSAMYLEVDHAGIARACRLHAKAEAGGKNAASGAELAELRQLEQLYGLSPRARRSLQWEIDRAAGPGTAHSPQEHDELQANRARRTRLSVVNKP